MSVYDSDLRCRSLGVAVGPAFHSEMQHKH